MKDRFGEGADAVFRLCRLRLGFHTVPWRYIAMAGGSLGAVRGKC
jgi:hypothetical protein